MKNLLITLLMAFLLSGCVTTVAMLVDGNPSLTPEELSLKLSGHYAEIGLLPYDQGDYPNQSTISAWSWFEKPNSGLLFHYVKKGLLQIRIIPAPGHEGAAEIKRKILVLLSEISPNAEVQIREIKEPDIR